MSGIQPEVGADTARAAIQDVRALLSTGEPLLAYDQAIAELDRHADNTELRYLSVLALARSGAIEYAESRFHDLGLDRGELPKNLAEDVPALAARLAKDRALGASGDRRRTLAAEASQRYAGTFVRTGGHYSGVNAATMAVLAGHAPQGAELARQARAAADRHEALDEAGSFWRHASLAEAELLLGDPIAAEEQLRAAVASAGDAPARRAVTRRQLRLVGELTGVGVDACLAVLANPAVVHFCGNRFDGAAEYEAELRAHANTALAELDVGAGWGALAAGGDLLWAEALLERGALLHVVMPCAIDEFVDASVIPSGEKWRARFDDCLANAASVTFATEGPLLGHDVLFEYTSRRAMGEAVLHADRLDAAVHQVAIWDGRDDGGSVGTAADVVLWRASGRSTRVVAIDGERRVGGGPVRPPGPERALRAMLFGDVKGFSRLDEDRLPVFFEEVMGALARVLAGADAVRYRNSWGDGIYVVVDDAVAAARIALELQSAINAVDHAELGLPPDLRLRLGAHAGPVFAGHDPIRDEPTFFGAEVTRTARIEPRTPEGEVYVTDAFAALVRLDAPDDFTCEYVGHVSTAKGYGTLPMYRLAARS